MIARFHFPAAIAAAATAAARSGSDEIELPEALAHHALRVLRLRDGEQIVLFDGQGGEYSARLQVDGRRCRARLEPPCAVERESPLQLVLVQALAAGEKMDWVIQKAVELGVNAIVPVQAERSVLRLSGERAAKRLAHWQQVVISACEQSGRNRIPTVAAVRPLNEWLNDWRSEQPRPPAYVLAPGAGAMLGSGSAPAGPVYLLIGPEGGWSEAELQALTAAGCEVASLGPRVLRTETAGLAALTVLQARWGDFSAAGADATDATDATDVTGASIHVHGNQQSATTRESR
ncbi:MAG: 16S rRNA (uracil(1498)-N(3))-methyltransferase [Pseudomonadales bacterium]|nr:16S rRNA (uracil(1498)-N(3))-methyltransferase [Pseudomonadales bacterium]